MNKVALMIMVTLLTQIPGSRGNIIVNVDNFRSNKGEVRIALFNSESGFPDKPEKAYRRIKGEIKHKRSELYFNSLHFGVYAISLFHDENSNGKIDTNWLGIPTEGYGFSNDAKASVGPPSFEDAKFELNSGRMNMRIKLQY